MTYEEVKRIRDNLTIDDVDNEELSRMIDIAIDMQIPKRMKLFKDQCECGHQCFPHMNFCDTCGKRLEWVKEQ